MHVLLIQLTILDYSILFLFFSDILPGVDFTRTEAQAHYHCPRPACAWAASHARDHQPHFRFNFLKPGYFRVFPSRAAPGWFGEVRAMVSHYPYLLALTDAHGFSALYHAVMSGEPEFLSKACSGTGFLSYRQPPPLNKNILECLRKTAGKTLGKTVGSKYVSTSFGFPVTLEFRGNAAIEILAKDGWTPTHGAAGRAFAGSAFLFFGATAVGRGLAQLMRGGPLKGARYTDVSWDDVKRAAKSYKGDPRFNQYAKRRLSERAFSEKAGQRSNRRALSAGPCGGKRKPAKKAPRAATTSDNQRHRRCDRRRDRWWFQLEDFEAKTRALNNSQHPLGAQLGG
eukprot:Skav217812  [mRNA]  locus=scaffold889:69820:83430:+ [translate_table: standard]